VNTHDTAARVRGVLRCVEIHYRTRTRQTRDLKPVGFPVPVTIPTQNHSKASSSSHEHVLRQVFSMLSPYKAPGQDQIPNVVLMKCIEALIDHLFFIYRAVFELRVYHPAWLKSLTVVLRKIGKTNYDVAKSYCPVGLIDTIPKGLSTLVCKHISHLMEKNNLFPAEQFGGRPGRNTTDAMLLVVDRIKNAWRAGKVTAALFLDIQGAFPNTG